MPRIQQGSNNAFTINFTGGPWTFTRTAVSGAEDVATFNVSDSAGYLRVRNGTGSGSAFVGDLTWYNSGSALSNYMTSTGVDSGSVPVHIWNFVTNTPSAFSSRPLLDFRNNNTAILQVLPLNSGANSCLSWGTQTGAAPAFTTRSIGTKLVLKATLGASDVDIGIGEEGSASLWYSVPRASSSYTHKWYGGTTLLATLGGGGVLSLGTNTTLYSRLGQKLETNTSANYGGAALNTWSASAAEASLLDLNRSKSATIGTYTVVANGDTLGVIAFRGADGSTFASAGQIRGEVDGTPGASDMPGRLTFWTTPDASASPSERMRITNAGDVGVGKTPTTGIILDVNGQLGLKSYTVATLPSASVQAGAIVYASDAGGNGPCLVISNGTNWKRCDNTSTTVS